MCDEAVNDSIAILKLISVWFLPSKLIKKLFTALYADENILYFNEDSGNVVFFLVMKWVFLIMILVMLMLIIIVMKMILILLF